ncbi:MAG: hypothetical protein LC689_06675 [Myxococcales bacterium]|nr:hypothetical protein [Myxococcales bacterium]
MEARLAKVAIAAAAAFALWHALWVSAVTDDAGIALAYAQNLASGQGLRLTPFSPRVEAYSDPLWVLWLALGYALHVGGPQFARISGALFAAGAVWLIGHVRSRKPRMYDAVGPWLLALDTTYTFWAGSGLESGAFALALSATMMTGSPIAAGLMPVLRPEGILYLVQRRRLRWFVIALLPLAAWVAFRRVYYGEWLPNSFYAKRSWDYGGFWYLNAWFLDSLWHWALYLSPLAFIAKSTRQAALAALPGCAAAVAFILYSKGDWMAGHRFAAHALPAAALAAGLVPPALQELLGGRDRDAGWLSAAALVLLAAIAAPARSLDRKLNPVLPLAYVAEQGRWFRRTANALGLTRPRIAHFDIGGLALESGGEVIDLAGLADRYIGRVGYQNQKAVEDYVFDRVKPQLMNIHGPCQYLHDDPRLERDYWLAATGPWGENWVRKSLELDGIDDTVQTPARPVVRPRK